MDYDAVRSMFDLNEPTVLRTIAIDRDVSVDVKTAADPDTGHLIHGLALWPASTFLARELYKSNDASPDVVVELGAGAGLVGLTLLRKHSEARVIFTDRDHASLNLINESLDLLDDAAKSRATTEILEWGRPLSAELRASMFNAKKLMIVGADLIYSTEVVETLFDTVRRAFRAASPESDVSFTFCSSFRHPDTETLVCERYATFSTRRVAFDTLFDSGVAAEDGRKIEVFRPTSRSDEAVGDSN